MKNENMYKSICKLQRKEIRKEDQIWHRLKHLEIDLSTHELQVQDNLMKDDFLIISDGNSKQKINIFMRYRMLSLNRDIKTKKLKSKLPSIIFKWRVFKRI